jgi:hypothetical protein
MVPDIDIMERWNDADVFMPPPPPPPVLCRPLRPCDPPALDVEEVGLARWRPAARRFSEALCRPPDLLDFGLLSLGRTCEYRHPTMSTAQKI